jgi:hypothetical protein
MFGAMRLLGKTVELVRFPEESHDISRGGRPDRRVERLQRIAGWFERFLGTATSERHAEVEVDTQVLATRSLAATDDETVEAWAVAPDVAEPVRAVEAEIDSEAVVLAPEVETYDLAPVIAPAVEAPAVEAVPEAEAATTPEPEPVAEAQATQPPAAETVDQWQATQPPAPAPVDEWQTTQPPAPEPSEAADDWHATQPPAVEPAAAQVDEPPVFPEPEPVVPEPVSAEAEPEPSVPEPVEAAPQPVAIATEPVLTAQEAAPEPEAGAAVAEPEPVGTWGSPAPASSAPNPVVETIIAWPRGTGPDVPSNGESPGGSNSEEATSIIPAWQPSDVPESKRTVSLQAVPPEVIAAGGGYPAKLTFESGPFEGRIVALPNEMVTFGRAPDNDIVVGDPATSGRHGRIEVRGTAFWISDLGSTNGTLVNGEPVIEKQLNHGDLIAIGQNTIRFTLEG